MSSDESVFGVTSHTDWAEMVAKLLGGALPESLNRIDEDGLVIGQGIECPLHQGRFDVTSGKALSAPACIGLETFPTRIEGGNVYIKI